MRTKTTAVLIVTFALALAALIAALRVPHERNIPELIYRPARQRASMIKTDFLMSRGAVAREKIYVPQPPTDAELAGAIYQQNVGNGLHGFNLLGWDFLFILRDSGNGRVNYSAIATRAGTQEYYYSIQTEVARERVRVWASPPIAMRICADRTIVSPDRECADGSRSEPFVKQ